MFYKILSHDKTKGSFFAPQGFFNSSGIGDGSLASVSLGRREENVEVMECRNLHYDELMISRDVVDSLMIPTGIMFQARFEEGGIRLGPCLGLLMAGRKMELAKARLRKLMPYTLIYPEIRGLLIAMSVEGIDFEGRFVEGCCYSPDQESGGLPWRFGKFPLPNSVFTRLSLPEPIRTKLKESTGNRLFNSCYFNKWEFWKLISEHDIVNEHLPLTRLYSSIDDVNFILSYGNAAYLKPAGGTLSKGLYKIIKTEQGYIFQDRYGNKIRYTYSMREANLFLTDITDSRIYLVQQSVDSVGADGMHVSFRVIMQKNHAMKWLCTGMVAFIGRSGDICSNWGTQASFEDFFADYLNYSQKQIFKLRQEVVEVCGNVCHILDLTAENFGDLGFDVIIDRFMKVWVIEVNKRHYHSAPLWINDKQMFYETKANPVRYAAALDGFNVY